MNKIKKRFVAMLVVFTSIISFLPVGFGGQAANAASTDVSTDATSVRVNVDKSSTPLTTRTDSEIKETIYTTESIETAFDVTVKDVQQTLTELKQQAEDEKKSITGITKQEVVILDINNTKLVNDNGTANTAGIAVINAMGIEITYGNSSTQSGSAGPTPVDGDSARIGAKITGLPAGVNKITYAVKITTLGIIYKEVKNSDGTTTITTTPDPDGEKTSTKSNNTVTIEHGKKYVMEKISKMKFDAYVGEGDVEDSETTKNNTTPFLYTTVATPDDDMNLRYNYDVPDSLSALKYTMTFGALIDISSGVTLFKNGVKLKEEEDYKVDGQSLTGDLKNPDKSDLIVVRIDSVEESDTSTVKIARAYSIEIRYNKQNTDEDFSLINSGITKYNYAQDNSVQAYIGKKFTVEEKSDGYKQYTGDIYIDKKANMISIDPDLVRSKSTLAYVVTNNYIDSGDGGIKKSVLKDGKQYIDFKAGSSNQIQVDVYEGTNGSKTSSSKLLARYILKVNLLETSDYELDLAFDNNADNDLTYLTQPGVKDNKIEEFSTDRRTYDLYTKSEDTVNVSFGLKKDDDQYTGIRSSKNEYLRVYIGDYVNSDNLKEVNESKENALDSNYARSTSIDVNFGTAQKIVVQAYYDEFKLKEDGTVKTDDDGNPEYVSYKLGDEYVFYLAKNYVPSEDVDGKADNAYLNSLKIKDGTLQDSDGNEKFSSEVLDYTATVKKENKTAIITATAQDDNVESIVATINGNEDSYDLENGVASELPLNENGKTTINIRVTAQDGTTTKIYTIEIKNNTKSNNVNLSNIILNTGDYKFNSSDKTTKVHVSQSTTNLKITPIPEDSKATITVDGQKYADNAISVSLRGSQKTDIEIVVKSEDGTESKTYTLEVFRTDSSEWGNNGEDGKDDGDDQYYDEYYECWVDTTKYDEWGTVKSKPAYFDKNNRQVKEAWITTGGKLYYLNSSGYRSSGWKVDDVSGKTYYLDQTTGEMRKGWMNLNGSMYYLGLNGVMHKGWLSLNEKWYYFTPNGQMVVSQSMFISDKVYKFGQDGAVYQ